MTTHLIPPVEGTFSSFLIFGPPGAGKGTIGKMLCQAAGLVHVSSGDIFRGLSPSSPAGSLTRSYLDEGRLVPDEVTIAIWRNYVEGLIATNRYHQAEQHLLLDGIPRTEGQAEALQGQADVKGIILLEVDHEKELIKRLQKRAKIEGRSDDLSEDILQRRFQIYKNDTAKVLSLYDPHLIHRFNAQQPIPCVLRDVLQGMADKLI